MKLHYRHIDLRVIELDLPLDYPSKFDRSADHIERLMHHGREKARAFLADAKKARWTREKAAAYQGIVDSRFPA